MRLYNVVILTAAGLALTSCAERWEPKGPGLVITDPACPGKKAPYVTDFSGGGVGSIYLFTVDGAPKGSINALLKRVKKAWPGADIGTVMLNLGGVDTLFVTNEMALADQAAVDAQFATVCGIHLPGIFLNNVRYHPIAAAKDPTRAHEPQ